MIDVLARLHPDRVPPTAVVRWTIPVERLFPENGFTLIRRLRVSGQSLTLLQDMRLPGALLDGASQNWIIEDAQIAADHAARGATMSGAALPPLAAVLTLKPILAFALPLAAPDILETEIEAVAKMLGDSHATNLELEHDHWPGKPAPDRSILASMRHGDYDLRRAYDAIVDHYRLRATVFLLFSASDFGMAKLLGLGVEDELPQNVGGPVEYRIEATWNGRAQEAMCTMFEPRLDWPAPPILDPILQNLSKHPALAGYSGFARFFAPGARWMPQAPANDSLSLDLIETAKKGPRICPTPSACITWKPSANADPPTDGLLPLLSRNAYAWQIERFDFGAETAKDEFPPPLDPAAAFKPCHDADPLMRGKKNHFEDDIDLPWGAAPLEGWYAYRLRGIDLFGIVGPPSTPMPVLLRDRFAPSPPRATLDRERVELPMHGTLKVSLTLDWEAPNEFSAPDAVEFRVYQQWTSVAYQPLVVLEVVQIKNALKAVQVDIIVGDAGNHPVPQSILDPLVDSKLLTFEGEFTIISAPGNSTLRVRRSAGRAPPLGGVAAQYAVAAIESASVARLTRMPAIPGAVRLLKLKPLTLELIDATRNPITSASGTLYLYLLGEHYTARDENGHFIIDPPSGASQRALNLYGHVNSLTVDEAKSLLDGSPALFLPLHRLDVLLDPPSEFTAGTLRLGVSAADGASYVTGTSGVGNEGPRCELMVAARGAARPVPASMTIPRFWARDAGEFVEHALTSLSWTAMKGAVRYEVERVLESGLGLSPGASEDALLHAAQAPTSDVAYERVTNAAFLPRWSDSLPGRAPTRAVYRVRGISAAGVASDWQVVALVRVSDVRIAPRPSLLLSVPVPGMERAILCRWVQPGPIEGIGFVIETRPIVADTSADEGWCRVCDFLPSAIRSDDAGRFQAVVPDCSPGLWQEFRIVPIRHALDPEDPRAQMLRRIDGWPSNPMRARANGELHPPENMRAVVSAAGIVTLRWRSQDRYAGLELRRRAPGRSGFERREIDKDAEMFCEDYPLSDSGEWIYELAAIGHGRRVLSEQITIDWRKT
ncbi:hypothetical protein [Pseudomonas frederiksbergensis]|uniref:hypothetical protein n=1 Tax=Pseudomonas frederiksbergensis TaxID=104087 RepID=UPI003D1E3945